VVVPRAQVWQLEVLLAGPPADQVPIPHILQDGPAKPGLQAAWRNEVTAKQHLGCHDNNAVRYHTSTKFVATTFNVDNVVRLVQLG
jgi:hypothetical protein